MSLTPPTEPVEPVAAAPVVQRRRRRPAQQRQLRWIILALGVILLGFLGWYEANAHPFGGPGAPVTITVKPGESFGGILDSLAATGVVTSSLAFQLSDVVHGTPTVLPGSYTIPRNSTFQAVRAVLSAGPNTESLVVPPGFTLREVVLRLDSVVSHSFAASVNRALTNGSIHSPYQPPGSMDLEGLIAPGTYLIRPQTTGQGLVHAMVARFSAMAGAVGIRPSTILRGHDAYSLITIASIVEKEGYLDRNMAKVASVIDNRLSRSMPLQMDATVLYAIGQDGGTVTHATEQYQSPYNSYLNHGLPPTPICTPSPAALAATVSPTPGPWLYFTVIDKSGTEAFSATFDEQLANEKLAAERGL